MASKTTTYSPLINYTLKGLSNCWMPASGRWSHIYHLDGRAEPNQSIPESDLFYSLNVLLGMARLSQREALPVDVSATLERLSLDLPKLPVKKYAYGMALWASAELAIALPRPVEDLIFAFVEKRENWKGLRAQDIGMLVTGLATQVKAGNPRGRQIAPELFAFLVDRYSCPSGLFFDEAEGWRRNFGSFATQTYLTLACYNFYDAFGDERALKLANACARKLIALQGPQGEWPWFFYVPGGKVVDFYEVYSVHQTGMAPAWLEHAERHQIAGASDALVRGFEWDFGRNQLGVAMLRPDLGMTIRSQVRKGELESKYRRVLRSIVNAAVAPSQGLIDPSRLTLRLECRSYELGWILWSFGQRSDLPSLTHNEAFVQTAPTPLPAAN